jgi:hypothetical protein
MKFEPKRTMCTFINYNTYSKAYILVDCTTRKVKINHDVCIQWKCINNCWGLDGTNMLQGIQGGANTPQSPMMHYNLNDSSKFQIIDNNI